MEDPTSQKLKSVMIATIGLLVAVLFGWMIGTADYQLLIFAILGLVGVVFWFWSGSFFWVIAVGSSYLSGTFPILGGSFNPFQILTAIGLVKFVTEDLVMRRRGTIKASRIDLLLLAGFMGVLTFHGFQDRFGMRFLGSTVWGGRNYVNVYVGLLAFFILQSVPVRGRVWDKLPYLALLVTSFDLLVGIITMVFPSLIFKIYPFYSAVSTAGVVEALTGHEDLTGRIVNFGNFGFVLAAIVLAQVSLPRLFSVQNLSRIGALILASLSAIFSGFRTSVVNLSLTVFMAGVRDLRFRVLLLLPLVVAGLLGLSAINSSVIRLPKQAQRAIIFVPGDWDADMKRDAANSNDFRRRVWTIWMREYFPKCPLLGRGFGFRSEWNGPSVFDPKGVGVDLQQAVEVGNIHNGFLASLDAVGIIGTIFFLVWNVRLLFQTFRVAFANKEEGDFAQRFIALQLAVAILAYWGGAITVGTYLPQFFALAGVFLNLQRKKATEIKAEVTRPVEAVEFHPHDKVTAI